MGKLKVFDIWKYQPTNTGEHMHYRVIVILTFLFAGATDLKAQTTSTYQRETEVTLEATGTGTTPAPPTPAEILPPDQIWHDPSAQYRMLDPWRIAMEFGGGIVSYDDMEGEIRQGGTTLSNFGRRVEESAGLIFMKAEVSGRVSRSDSVDWYHVTALTYEGRGEDDVIKIRSGTHGNENLGTNIFSPVTSNKILNRNQTSIVTGIRVMSRTGSFAYQGAYLTGLGSRKWFEDDLLWVNRIEFDLAYRFPDALIGPFLAGKGEVSLNSDEIARAEILVELGARYVNDIRDSWLTMIDGFMYVRGGRWSDDTKYLQAEENIGILGAGVRLRVWNLLLELKGGYISSYSFQQVLASPTSSIPSMELQIDSSGEFEFLASLRVEF